MRKQTKARAFPSSYGPILLELNSLPFSRVMVITSNPSSTPELVREFAKSPFSVDLQVKDLHSLLIK